MENGFNVKWPILGFNFILLEKFKNKYRFVNFILYIGK